MSALAEIKQTASEPDSYRQVPQNLEAEQGLLGALLVDNRAI
jgi:hypothetical protein